MGLGFRVQGVGLGFRVQGVGLTVWDRDVGRAWGAGLRVYGLGFRAEG